MLEEAKVPTAKLKKTCKEGFFQFKTTEEVTPFEGIIGQERAVKAMEFGLKVKNHGYNLFMTGVTGTGKFSYAQNCVKSTAGQESVPEDWCYVYNFQNTSQPKALNFPAGKGKIFCEDIKELTDNIKEEISKAFEGEGYEKEKAEIITEFQQQRNQLMEELSRAAQEKDFFLKRTPTGFVTIPVVDGEQLSQEDFDQLELEIREDLEIKMNQVQIKAMEVTRKILSVEKRIKEKLKELEQKVGLFAVGDLFDCIKGKYENFQKAVDYLEEVKKNVLEHLDDFQAGEEEQQFSLPWGKKSKLSEERYSVNLLIDHSESTGAPVVIETNPTFYNLVGKLEYESQFGMVVTDFTMIKPGSLHLANGGYLIIHAMDLLNNYHSWDVLKRVIKNKELRIENLQEQIGLVAVSALRPEPIPIKVKVIVIGSPYLYRLLFHHDEDFRKLFKIKVDFDTEMDRTEENQQLLAGFISCFCEKAGLKHVTRQAVGKVVEFSSRLAGHQEKMTTRFSELIEILYEADGWSSMENADLITAEHIKKAYEEKVYRSNKLEKKIHELFKEGTYLIDVQGEKVGQVNALSVVGLGDYMFGRPSRITAVTHLGRRGIVNIEREVKMSGKIHNKGVLILGGYLAAAYAQEIPLTLSATLTFEQLYEGVEGDSASSTELYALLSSLAGLPLRQDISVTGSVNQMGEIQPIGGVNEKIEGFFTVCKMIGLTGTQGVMIPHQNVVNLMLSDEVIEAVEREEFHIYAVKNINQGIELLTGIPAGKINQQGVYPENTVNYLVDRKLKQYNKAITRQGRDNQTVENNGKENS
ncbi:Lon protease family protein [Candidatus Contubernalis alkaliaceticus]|uniref:Lon protease family protein n=1 Tax=Candidatus Contubernalis alkaliaceticus TaxID=338645 RepID=UPI001F4BDAE3|nr:ATP-binding protein [Candidatus Contubernalis alkalaceticus]UNC91527.1 AAA family ATPase [Candidatus Contubernalis alkalaceticus]